MTQSVGDGPDRRAVLSDADVSSSLATAPGWSGDHAGIVRVVEAASFVEGIALVVAIAEIAEAMDHHPDIDIRWRTVHFRLTTHSAGGVTALDVAAARAFDEVLGVGG